MDEVIGELRRIADAFEAQNDFNERWMAQQKTWREEDERVMEQRYQEHSARENKIAMAAIDHYTRNQMS